MSKFPPITTPRDAPAGVRLAIDNIRQRLDALADAVAAPAVAATSAAATRTSAFDNLTNTSAGSYVRSGGGSPIAWSVLKLPNAATTGDLMYASAANEMSVLADVAVGDVLLSGGVGVAPSYGKVSLTVHVSGILAVANGGTGASDAAGARTNLGVTATGADTTYAFRANNLSDLASASAARSNLGVTATGADTTYAFRSNNLSDLANAATARTNLGLGSIATQASSNVSITGGSITGITDLAVADGGTGSSTAAGARTNLGAIGGSTGTTDNALLRADGTGAATSQSSAVICDDSGNLSGNGTLWETVSATTYTVTAADNGKIKRFTSGTGCTITLPQQTTETLTAGFGVGLQVAASGASATIVKEGSDTLEGIASLSVGGLAFAGLPALGTPRTWVVCGG